LSEVVKNHAQSEVVLRQASYFLLGLNVNKSESSEKEYMAGLDRKRGPQSSHKEEERVIMCHVGSAKLTLFRRVDGDFVYSHGRVIDL
jgi:hypothetical protein